MKKKIAVSTAVISALLAINAGAENAKIVRADAFDIIGSRFEVTSERDCPLSQIFDFLGGVFKPNTDKPDTDTPDTDKPAIPDGEENDGSTGLSDYASEVLALVNAYRAENGLAALVLDRSLCRAADIRAEEIKSVFSHTRPDGSGWVSVLALLGIEYSGAGENLACGQSSPSEVMNAWIASSGHRANILGSSFTKIGIGVSSDGGRLCWTQIFTY